MQRKRCCYCKTRGHTIKVCHKKQKSAKKPFIKPVKSTRGNSGNDFNNNYDDVLDIFQLTSNSNPTLKITLLGNSKPITMEIDTRASTSLINHNTFIKLSSNASKLTLTSNRIRKYAGEAFTPMGEAELEFAYNNQKAV